MRAGRLPHSSNESAREKLYRQFYLRVKTHLVRQDDVLQYLLGRIDGLQKRVDKLENEKKS